MRKIIFGLFLSLVLTLPAVVPALAVDFELGGELRIRYENENMNRSKLPAGAAWDKDAIPGEDYWSQRARLNAKFLLDDKITAFFSLHTARAWGEEGAAANNAGQTPHPKNRNTDVGLNQGWLQIDELIGPVGVKLGRQVLSYGKMRILGDLDWPDTGNRWDASKVFYKSEAIDADLFFAKLSNEDTDATPDENLNGLYVTVKAIPMIDVDIYAIQKDTVDGVNIMTYGLRAAGEIAGLDWDVEYAAQSGDIGKNVTQNASAWAGDFGYTFRGIGDGLRIGIQSWAGSGDDDVSDDKNETFDNLYPTNHPIYGISDVAGSNNLGDRSGNGFNISYKPVKRLKIKAEYFTVNQQTSGDKVGDEVNLQVWFVLTDKVKWYTYLTQFTPDEKYVGEGNSTDSYQLVGTQIQAKF